MRHVFKAIRIHQWPKNLLLFVPLVLAHKLTDQARLLEAGIAFLAFSLCASSLYILNDLVDIEADRAHPVKKHRPFAAGHLKPRTGIFLGLVLLVASFALALQTLPPFFSRGLGLYLGFALAYSFYLKQFPIVDVFVLAGLYTLRIIAGAIAVNVIISPWLLAFSMFFFTNLAFIKRFSELRLMESINEQELKRRHYTIVDLELIRIFGATCGFLSVLVFVLYVNDSKEILMLYQNPTTLWLVGPFLLFWISRLWLLANRGQMPDDPIAFTIKDPVSYAVGIVIVMIMSVATGG